MEDVAIIGVGLHPFGRFGEKSAIDMAADAVRAACADAGVQWPDVQFAFGGSYTVDNPDAVIGHLGLTGIPFMDVYNGCATAATALQLTADAIRSGKYDLIVLNYANPDMVGHTGNLAAAIKAVEAVDEGLGRLAQAIRSVGGAMLVTADHGNCELMRDPETGGPHTAHTTNPVPVLLVDGSGAKLACGRLADVAPTLLDLMGLPKPVEMSGVTLLRL